MSKRLVFLSFLGLGVVALTATPAFCIDIRIAGGMDDVEEYAAAHNVYVDSSDLEMPYENTGAAASSEQVIGLRFAVPFDKGVAITKAYVEFTCDETKGGTEAVNLVIDGQLIANAPAFTSNNSDVTNRTRTKARVAWPVDNWTTVGQKSQTPDLTAILQEIMDQPGWANGSAIVLIFSDDKSKPSKGVRCADAIEDGSTGPLLHIEVFNPMASAPSPANGATGVNMALFSWTKGDGAILHNIYFGTTPDLTEANLAAKNQPFAMYYHVAGLEPGNIYYWRVDEIDAAGKVTTGPVWSFSAPSKKAFEPSPKNSAKYVAANAKLTWTPGYGMNLHTVYFGTALDEVANATGGTSSPVPEYTPASPLAKGATYYWRVDESDGKTTIKGDVWSFTTLPDIAATDPDLIGWWMFEEGSGDKTMDFSGKGNDGTLGGGTKWVDGVQGLALQLTSGYVVIDGVVDDMKGTNVTFSAWVKTTQVGEGELFAGNTSSGGHPIMFGVWNGVPFVNDGSNTYFTPLVNDGQWHMLTYVRNGSSGIIYVDGVQTGTYTAGWSKDTITRWSIGQEWDPPSPSNFLDCTVDDARIYNKPLTADEVKELMRGDPTLAWKPNPDNKATIDVVKAKNGVAWAAGDNAKQHDVYFGTDKAAVADATAADKTGVYRGRQAEAKFTPAEELAWGTGPYYWRVDEVQDNGTISMGPVWSFSVADFLIVDDMEGYTDDEGSRIYETWVDGWTNNTGAVVGNLTAPFAERTIVHGGSQSMPMDFNNAKTPFYSEAEQTFSPLQNWTSNDVTTLTLWVRGNPVRFVDKGNGAFTVGASGHDIWDNADDFRFIYKKLNGDGSVQVKVESLVNTNAWAKAGVMIRDDLDAGARMAYMIESSSSGVSFGWRQNMGLACGSATQAGITAPQWVKLTRKGNAFTAQYSADGKTWTDIKDATTGQAVSTTIGMGASVYIGLCVTSHNTAAATAAELSGAATTGGVTGSWQQAWIGDDPDRTNGSAPLYVAVEDSAGKVAVASDPTLVNAGVWTEWKIPLSSLTGVNLAKVKKLYVGVGDRKNPVAGGAGRLYIDDIRLTKP